jgi:small conductance mechanosensitive channel
MLIRMTFAFLIAAALLPVSARPAGSQERPDARGVESIVARIAEIRASSLVRDSLIARADSTRGASREYLEELIAQREADLHAGILSVIASIRDAEARGVDVTEARRALAEASAQEWPRHLAQLEGRARSLVAMGRASDAASGAERVTIEAQMSQYSDRLLGNYEWFVDVLLALERAGIDVSQPRALVTEALPPAAHGMVTRLQLAQRAKSSAVARLSRDAANTDLRYAVEAADERLDRAAHSLTAAIDLMGRLHLATTDLRVARIAETGTLNADIFQWPVLTGLMQRLWTRLLEFFAAQVPRWLFKGMVIILTFLAFRALAHVVRSIVRPAIARWRGSELMRRTVVRFSGTLVMVIGFVVILTQLGVQVAPLLAGFGILGVVIGFALQSTLSNFAAGGMILGNQPFDIGDEIEVAGASGTVKRMTLVSTTIMTPDNQTLIIPNSTVWGDVIRNRTTQPVRRVDMTFGIGYQDDIEHAERVLQEIVARVENVLKSPAPVIKLHQLADSSVNFIVRVWAPKAQYWDVYWELTRAVKLGFDREGISIPFPQRELHVNVRGDAADAAAVTAAMGTTPPDR